MIAAQAKRDVVTEHQRHETDSGSPEVQIAILTARIHEVATHIKEHKHDYHSRRGLVLMVGKRNRLLRYLQRVNRDRYLDTIKKLGLRK